MRYLYRCTSEGPVNNGKNGECDFEMECEEGPYNCPICGNELLLVSKGPSVSELLRRGEREANQKKGNKMDEKTHPQPTVFTQEIFDLLVGSLAELQEKVGALGQVVASLEARLALLEKRDHSD